jgi:hypothetical protein
MGLSEFPDIFLPVILYFGGHIGDVSLCDEISLARRRHTVISFTFSSEKTLISSFLSRPGHGRPSGQFPESS